NCGIYGAHASIAIHRAFRVCLLARLEYVPSPGPISTTDFGFRLLIFSRAQSFSSTSDVGMYLPPHSPFPPRNLTPVLISPIVTLRLTRLLRPVGSVTSVEDNLLTTRSLVLV